MIEFKKITTLGVLALAAVASNMVFGQVESSARGENKDAPTKQTAINNSEKSEAVAKEPTFKKFTLETIQGDRVDLAATRMPIATLIDAVKKSGVVSKKGEFESTADYEARKTAAHSTSFLGDSALNETFAISVPLSKWAGSNFYYTFNPDTNEGAFFVFPDISTGGFNGIYKRQEYGEGSGLDFFPRLITDIISKSTYEGVNSYGAKVKVEKIVSVSYGLASNRIQFLKFNRKRYYGSDLPVTSSLASVRFKMDNATASKMIPELKVLIVFSLRDPFIIEDTFHVEPKINQPLDLMTSHRFLRTEVIGIIWYSNATGEILARLPESFGKAEIKSAQGADSGVAPTSEIK